MRRKHTLGDLPSVSTGIIQTGFEEDYLHASLRCEPASLRPGKGAPRPSQASPPAVPAAGVVHNS
ncbi:hypothetical protein E2C01_003573 [Portunus trituberculatus]|uniref:Uncharacterized protein n=1 Tax=Portunus trituberculatus TaxID=210409 RepID=A0A5B7CNC8_PORTR|nr:hypothetical protein [Portunus trituberculatus]